MRKSKIIRWSSLWLVAVLCGYCGLQTANAYRPIIFNQEIIESITNAEYRGVCSGDADPGIPGNEVYLSKTLYTPDLNGTLNSSVSEANVVEFQRLGVNSWSYYMLVGKNSGGEINYNPYGAIAIGDVDPIVPDNELYLAKYNHLTSFYSDGFGWSHEIVVVGPMNGQQGRQVAIGNADPNVGNPAEIYFIQDDAAAKYYQPGGGWGAQWFDNWPGVNFGGDVAVGDALGYLPGNEFIDAKVDAGGAGHVSVFWSTGPTVAGADIEQSNKTMYTVVVADVIPGNTDPNWIGNEVCMAAGVNTPDPFGRTDWVSAYNVYAGFKGVPNETRSDIEMTGTGRKNYCLAAGDLDGDGLAELVLGAGGPSHTLKIFYWNGTGWSGQVLSNSFEVFDVQVVDIDGDGLLDILYGGKGQAGVYLNSGNIGGCVGPPVGDLSGDCVVNLNDLQILSAHWLENGNL